MPEAPYFSSDPWFLADNVFPDDQSVEQHVHAGAFDEARARRLQLQVGQQEGFRERGRFIEVNDRRAREIGFSVAEETLHQIENATDFPQIENSTEYDIPFLVVLEDQRGPERYPKS